MSPLWLLILVPVWLGLAGLARVAMAGPRRDPYDILDGLTMGFLTVYLRLVHRVKHENTEHVRAAEAALAEGRPVIVIANHTAGTDPLLVQLATWKFEIRWMMAADMRIEPLEPLWKWSRIIDVERYSGDATSARAALRHLSTGPAHDRVLGIFPEGGIERPPEQLLPFLPGVGLLIKRSKALVLPALIDGTPRVDPAFASLWHTSHSRVRFGEPIDYAATDLKPAEIVADLQQRYLDWSGWPLNEHRTDGVGGSSEPTASEPLTVPA
ncbi:MAG: lysophospholipid acyltransferase family protein [Planctomycetota bacterium]